MTSNFRLTSIISRAIGGRFGASRPGIHAPPSCSSTNLYPTMTDPGGEYNLRFSPVRLLRESGIRSVVWFEDAIAQYGVPTIVFDLHLLVDDIDIAGKTLIQHGWVLAPFKPSNISAQKFAHKTHRRLLPPNTPDPDAIEPEISLVWKPIPRPPPPTKKPQPPTTTILLPAADWNYEFPEPAKDALARTSLLPSLPDLVDALIDSFLDTEPNMLWSYLSCQVGYLYAHTPALQEASFAEQLKYEHRQFHFDSLSGMSTGTVPFAEHEREIRNALREGKYELQTCSASRENTTLFNEEVQKRLLAKMTQKDPSQS